MISIEAFDGDEAEWDRFVANSPNRTLFHRRSFLGYHGERWRRSDRSVTFWKGSQLVGVLPLGADASGCGVSSPWGASFGAPLLRVTTIADIREVVGSLLDHASEQGWSSVRIGLPPPEYQVTEATFEFALVEAGFNASGMEFTQIVKVSSSDPDMLLSSKARNKSRNAVAAFRIERDADPDSFFAVLAADRDRLGVPATHTHDQLVDIRERCPGGIDFEVATHAGSGGKAAACYFSIRPGIEFAFYLCQDNDARGANGVNALVLDRMRRLHQAGGGLLDFGTSSLSGVLNEGLATFKEGMGGRASLRRTYVLELKGGDGVRRPARP